MRAKICDLGISSSSKKSIARQGTPRYMAPELIPDLGTPNEDQDTNKFKISSKVDVYAFGIVLWELYNECAEWEAWSWDQVLVNVGSKNYRPPINPASTPFVVEQVIKACWTLDPDLRPSFQELLYQFAFIEEDLHSMEDLLLRGRGVRFFSQDGGYVKGVVVGQDSEQVFLVKSKKRNVEQVKRIDLVVLDKTSKTGDLMLM